MGSQARARGRVAWVQRLQRGGDGSPHETVLAALRRAVLDGAARPGALIPVDQVAEHFQVSSIPVREALKTLIGEGLVDHVPRAGYTVARLTLEELREFYLVRSALETAALSAAVRHAGPEDDAEAQRAYAALEDAVSTGDPRAYHRESRCFHMALLAPSRMRRLVHMVEVAWNMTEPVQPMAQVGAGGRTSLHQDHGRMLETFVARDADAFLEACAVHHGQLANAIQALSNDRGLFRD